MLRYFFSALSLFLLETCYVYTQYNQKLIYSVRSKLLLALGHSLLFCLFCFFIKADSVLPLVFYMVYMIMYWHIARYINNKSCSEYRRGEYIKRTNMLKLNGYTFCSILQSVIFLLLWYFI